MKNLLLVVISLLFFQSIHAQESEISNKIILGGSVNFITQKNSYPLSTLSINSGVGGIFSNSINDSKNTSFAISPYIGKEIKLSLHVGLQLDLRYGNYSTENVFIFGEAEPIDFERISNRIGIGLFTRHMFSPGKNFSFFIQPNVEYNLLNEDQSHNDELVQEEKAHYLELGVGLGFLYNISDKTRVMLRSGGINYVNGNWKLEGTDISKNFSSLGTSINLSSFFLGFELRI